MPFLKIEQEISSSTNRKFKRLIVCICDVCNQEFKRKYQKSEVEKSKKYSFCSKKCMYAACKVNGLIDQKKKDTCLQNYGFDHQSKSPEISKKIVQKSKETCIERYGVENFGLIPQAKEKAKLTMLEKYGVVHSFDIDRATSQEKSKATFMSKYGVEHPMQVMEIREKRKQTCLKKYGVENVAQSEAFKEKFKSTMIERYGVENPLSLPDIRLKIEKTCLEKYGVRFSSQSDVSKAASKKTCIERYGFENQMQSDNIKNKMKNTCFKKFGVTCVFQNPEVKKKVRQKNSVGVSKKETAFFDRLIKVFKKVDRHVNVAIGISTREVDYYIHDIDCFVNYNGVYWHGKNKTDEELALSASSQSNGIRRTKRYDAELILHFNKCNQRFMVVWENEEDVGLQTLISISNAPTLDAWFASDPAIRKQKILGESSDNDAMTE